jgi:methionyl-tRNA formyltransferase
LRVTVITQGTSKVLESILESEHEVVGIIESSPVYELNSFLRAAGKFLTSIYYSFTLSPLNLRLFSKKMQIPYYFFRKRDNEGLEKWVKSLEPDLIVVYSMSHLLTENIFSIPKFGTVNLHYSYLPEYRGPTPVFWEYYDYVLNPGVTIHYLDKGEDTGDIIYQKRIHIKSGEKFENVNQKLSFIGAKLISKLMKDLERRNISRIKQSISSPTIRARKIKPEEYSGLIKWDEWDVERVFHFLSGTSKYHSTLLNKNRLHRLLFQVKILDREKCDTSGYKIGKLYKENSKKFFVCKDGKIYVDFKLSTANFFAWFYPYIS